MERSYLIRYGSMGQVGRFDADPGARYERGQTVVLRSHRGTELGEVLTEAPNRSGAEGASVGTARVLRAAGPQDVEQARLVDRDKDDRFEACQRVFRDGVWPIELIDVEPLLDDRRTVLHYLGPHRLNVSGVLAAFRATSNLDVMLQPVGRDVPDDETPADDQAHKHSCGDCSSDGTSCGTGGSCGSSSSGCSDCGVKKLLSFRR